MTTKDTYRRMTVHLGRMPEARRKQLRLEVSGEYVRLRTPSKQRVVVETTDTSLVLWYRAGPKAKYEEIREFTKRPKQSVSKTAFIEAVRTLVQHGALKI